MFCWKNCIPCILNPHEPTQGFVQEMNQVHTSHFGYLAYQRPEKKKGIYWQKINNQGLVYLSINAEEKNCMTSQKNILNFPQVETKKFNMSKVIFSLHTAVKRRLCFSLQVPSGPARLDRLTVSPSKRPCFVNGYMCKKIWFKPVLVASGASGQSV